MPPVSLLASDPCRHVWLQSYRRSLSSTCVCVHITHIPRQDGNRLYQPHQRKSWGGISIHLIQEIMDKMSVETRLFTALPGGRSWLFDPFGGPAAEGGGVDRGAVPRVATRRRMSH